MKSVFDQTKLGGMQLKNRFFRSATNDGYADERGHMTAKLSEVYEELAKGGVGTIITGLTYVTDREQPYPCQMGIYDDSFVREYSELTQKVHKYGANIILQLAALGSQTRQNENKLMWGPSTVKDIAYKTQPQEMAKEDIHFMQEAFAAAALRAKEAGFDGVQMHGAHGYLLNKFLTPYYNRRTDEYGGGIENRARLILETYRAIRQKVGNEYPVLIKINCEDFMDEGLTFEECRYVCKKLAGAGISAIEVSGGSGSSRKDEGAVRKTEGHDPYFAPYAAKIAKEVDVPIISVGGYRGFEEITKVLNNSGIEYISLCRPLIRESGLINRWKDGDMRSAECISCNKCFRRDGTRCIFNVQ